jgi:hypothetical protein
MAIPHRRRGTAVPLALSPAAQFECRRRHRAHGLNRQSGNHSRGPCCGLCRQTRAAILSRRRTALASSPPPQTRSGEGSRAERRLPVQGLRAIGGVFPISLDGSMSKDNTANVEYSFLGDGVCARTHPAPAPCNARERLVGGRSGLVANSGVGRRMGCTDPNFTLCWPPEIRNKARDSDGKVQHPLFGGIADRWFCIHCDQVFSGRRMTKTCGTALIAALRPSTFI